MTPDVLRAPAWVSQLDAARELHTGLVRTGVLIANGHLDAAETPDHEMGVTRASLDEEVRWRREASRSRRWLWRPLRDTLTWF